MMDRVMYGPCVLSSSHPTEMDEKKTLLVDSLNRFPFEWPAMIMKYSDSLSGPIMQKLRDAITAVAKEEGYTYILDCSSPENEGCKEPTAVDVSALVRKKLGIN